MDANLIRLLLVDDDEVDRRIVKRALRDADARCEFVEAETGAEALAWLREQRFDCVLLDVSLPDFTGLELLDRLAGADGEVAVPVVMLTGADDVTLAVEAMRRGARDYLVKDVAGRHRELMPAVVQRVRHDEALRAAKLRAEQDLKELRRELALTEQRERVRLSQVLHDDLQQILYGLKLRCEVLRCSLPKVIGNATDPQGQLEDILRLTGEANDLARSLARELNPPQSEGLVAAIRWLASHMQELHGLQVEVMLDEAVDLRSPEARALVLNLVRELLFNSAKHSGIDRARVCGAVVGHRLRLTVEDAGRGFDVAAARAAPGKHSLGLFSVEERVRLLGGSFDVHSAPGQGTRCIMDLPLEWAAAAHSNAGDGRGETGAHSGAAMPVDGHLI